MTTLSKSKLHLILIIIGLAIFALFGVVILGLSNASTTCSSQTGDILYEDFEGRGTNPSSFTPFNSTNSCARLVGHSAPATGFFLNNGGYQNSPQEIQPGIDPTQRFNGNRSGRFRIQAITSDSGNRGGSFYHYTISQPRNTLNASFWWRFDDAMGNASTTDSPGASLATIRPTYSSAGYAYLRFNNRRLAWQNTIDWRPTGASFQYSSNTWYWVKINVSLSSQTSRLRVYNAQGTVVQDLTHSIPNQSGAGCASCPGIGFFEFGAFQAGVSRYNPAGSFWYDDARISSSDIGFPGSGGTDPPVDTIDPTVSLTSPTTDQVMSGNFSLRATATDNVGVRQVNFYVGNNLVGSSLTPVNGQYSYALNTNSGDFVNGNYQIRAQAIDTSGRQSTFSTVQATISNIVPDTTPPSLTITEPSPNAIISGQTAIRANVSDTSGIDRVEFLVNGQIRNTDRDAPYSYTLDTTNLTNGQYTIGVRAFDASPNRNQRTESLTVTVNNIVAKQCDFNDDGVVGLVDLSRLLANYGRNVTPSRDGDCNGDGLVSLQDLSILLSRYGQ